jgi:hypothetical protein
MTFPRELILYLLPDAGIILLQARFTLSTIPATRRSPFACVHIEYE